MSSNMVLKTHVYNFRYQAYILVLQSVGLSAVSSGYGTIILMTINTAMPFLSMFAIRKYKIRFVWFLTNGLMIVIMMVYFVLGFWTSTSLYVDNVYL